MIAKIKELRKNEEGFTLIELMVVVLIIGVLAAIAIPVFLNLQKEGIKAGVKSDVKNTVTNIATALASSGGGTVAQASGGNGDVTVTNGSKTATAKVVASEGNVIAVAPVGTGAASYGTYTVTGTNPNVTGFSYVFNSTTGAYAG